MQQERTYDLKQIRALAGFTQKDAAKLLNIHPLTYLNIEKNPGRLTLNQAILMAEAAGISIEQIKTQ